MEEEVKPVEEVVEPTHTEDEVETVVEPEVVA